MKLFPLVSVGFSWKAWPTDVSSLICRIIPQIFVFKFFFPTINTQNLQFPIETMVLMRRICFTINTIFFDAYTQYFNITRIVVEYFEVCF